MTSLQTLKGLISQRLCVAAEEIFILVERILTEYEELHLCSKQQPQQQQHTEQQQAIQPHSAGWYKSGSPALSPITISPTRIWSFRVAFSPFRRDFSPGRSGRFTAVEEPFCLPSDFACQWGGVTCQTTVTAILCNATPYKSH